MNAEQEQEYRSRLKRAIENLTELLIKAEDDRVVRMTTEITRLDGKIEGLNLALSYFNEDTR